MKTSIICKSCNKEIIIDLDYYEDGDEIFCTNCKTYYLDKIEK